MKLLQKFYLFKSNNGIAFTLIPINFFLIKCKLNNPLPNKLYSTDMITFFFDFGYLKK